jgi:hypothetical protein
MDENDLLSTNQFIKTPELTGEVPSQFNDEFKLYYRKELEKSENEKLRESLDKISIRSLQLDEETDSNSLLNTNKFTTESNKSFDIKRSTREIKTYVSVDSRDRTKAIFGKPNFFKIFLGKTFYNVRSIRLASIEFPNTNAVINNTNNKIYWRNQEDIDENIIDDVTKTYPIYSIDLRIGSYIASTLQSEIAHALGNVKRQNKTGDFHFFVVHLDLDTDIVTFTSLLLQQLPVNPLSVIANSNSISISYPGHGYEIGTRLEVYILGAKNVASIPSSTINGFHTATVISTSALQFEVNLKATETAIGGGNAVKLGEKAPFQLLFGEYSNTVASNIGFPLENSSIKINNYIKNIENIYQAQIVTQTPHGFDNTFTYVGKTCSINGSGTTPNIDGNRLILKVINNLTFLIQTTDELIGVTTSGQVTFGGNTLDIASISPVTIRTVLIETFSNHFYDASNIGKKITFSNTISVPSFDGENIISAVLSDTQFIINGNILGTSTLSYPVSEIGTGGVFSQHHILQTETKIIENIIPGVATKFIISSHGLEEGQNIRIYNVITSPSLLLRNAGIYKVLNVLDADTFTINFETISFDSASINTGEAYIGLDIVTVSFPYHGFNTLTSVTQPILSYNISSIINYDSNADGSNDTYRITTTNPHYLQKDFKITINGTDSIPIIDGTYTVLEKLTTTEFLVNKDKGVLTSSGTTGILTPKVVEIITDLNHGFEDGNEVTLNNVNATFTGGVSLNENRYILSVVSDDTFRISFEPTLLTNGTSGIIGLTHDFFLYGTNSVGGIPDHILYDRKYTVKDILDPHTFTFQCNGFSTSTEKLETQNIYISSLFHGFSGIQDNTKNNSLNRSINLEGENYVFLCCPQLATMMNTGNVKNIFARITLDQSPGSMVFAYLSNPKEFLDAPLDKLDELEFSIVNYDGTLYEFNDLDYSFVLEITEVIDKTDVFNFSSKRGMTYD